MGGWEGAGEGWGGVSVPRGGSHPGPAVPSRSGVAPHKDMSLPNVPSPGQARQRWHTGGEPWGVVPPPPILEHPGDSGGSPSFTAARLGLGPGSPSPKSLGGRQTRGLERNQGYGGGRGGVVCLCGGEASVRLSPRDGVSHPRSRNGDWRVRIWHTTHFTALPENPDAPALRVPAGERNPSAGGEGGGCAHCADPHRHRSPFWGQPPTPPRT